MLKRFPDLRNERFGELRERLLRAGIAPRHVRRYVRELSDHLADLVGEEERAGHDRAQAQSAAMARLGNIDQLAQSMIEQPSLRSLTARAPWAALGVFPLTLLLTAYHVAVFILWSGWQMFLPQSDTPFLRVHGFAVLYFAAGRLLYFGAPLFVGWALAFLAARQRLSAIWPVTGIALVALLGGAMQVHAWRVSGGAPQVAMNLAWQPAHLAGVLLYFSLGFFPWLAWRIFHSLFRWV
jgi:hypothetical protein